MRRAGTNESLIGRSRQMGQNRMPADVIFNRNPDWVNDSSPTLQQADLDMLREQVAEMRNEQNVSLERAMQNEVNEYNRRSGNRYVVNRVRLAEMPASRVLYSDGIEEIEYDYELTTTANASHATDATRYQAMTGEYLSNAHETYTDSVSFTASGGFQEQEEISEMGYLTREYKRLGNDKVYETPEELFMDFHTLYGNYNNSGRVKAKHKKKLDKSADYFNHWGHKAMAIMHPEQ